MDKKEIKLKKSEVITDIICDCCGCSCKVHEDLIDNINRIDDGETYYVFEYMELNATWGYHSDHDLERWSAKICEKCAVEKLSFINFKKNDYDWVDGTNLKEIK